MLILVYFSLQPDDVGFGRLRPLLPIYQINFNIYVFKTKFLTLCGLYKNKIKLKFPYRLMLYTLRTNAMSYKAAVGVTKPYRLSAWKRSQGRQDDVEKGEILLP